MIYNFIWKLKPVIFKVCRSINHKHILSTANQTDGVGGSLNITGGGGGQRNKVGGLFEYILKIMNVSNASML